MALPQISRQIADVGAAQTEFLGRAARKHACRSGAKSQIGRLPPVAQIVPTGAAGLGKVGDFVLFKARRCQPRQRHVVHGAFRVLGGQRDFPGKDRVAQLRALFGDEAVAAQVLRMQRQRHVEGLRPIVQRLSGQTEHQVKV